MKSSSQSQAWIWFVSDAVILFHLAVAYARGKISTSGGPGLGMSTYSRQRNPSDFNRVVKVELAMFVVFLLMGILFLL
jgi:hypothetical protein